MWLELHEETIALKKKKVIMQRGKKGDTRKRKTRKRAKRSKKEGSE